METYAGLAVDCGARIIGGCCGNTPGPCRRDAARPRRPSSGARPTVETIVAALGPLVSPAAAESGRRQPPSRPDMNAKAKRRAWARERESDEPDAAPARPGATPLVAARRAADFRRRRRRGAGERLDRFLGRAAAERRLALSRTRLKALIEAGEVTVDGDRSRGTPRRGSPRARASRFEAPPPEESLARGRGPAARRRLRGRASHRDRQAGRARRPSGARATPRARWSTR